MQTFVFFGHTAQPGYAGDLVALGVVVARDVESAARKLKGKVRDGGKDGWFDPSRDSRPFIRRLVASKLRHMTGKRPQAYEIDQHERRYSNFLLKRMPKIA